MPVTMAMPSSASCRCSSTACRARTRGAARSSREQDSATIQIEVPEQRRPDQSKLTVRFSPTIAGAVVDAIPYLASYPHGCTEQTLNRFVPAVIAQQMLKDLKINLAEVKAKRTNLNPQELGNAADRAAQWKQWQTNPVFDEVEMEKMVAAGVDKLMSMQNSDGGWGWFSGYGEIFLSAHHGGGGAWLVSGESKTARRSPSAC